MPVRYLACYHDTIKKQLRKFLYPKKSIQRAHAYSKLLRGGTSPDNEFTPVYVEDTEDRLEARRLHASVYLRIGFIDSWEVAADGTIRHESDPHHIHARYFAIKKKQKDGIAIVATARQIYTDPERGFHALPFYEKATLTDEGRRRIEQYDPRHSLEISGLVKKSGISPYATLLLYRLMWQYSYRNADELWVMACDVALYKRLRFLFEDAIEQVGHETEYKGGNVVPAILDVQRSVAVLQDAAKTLRPHQRSLKKNMLRFFLSGL